MGKKHAKAKLKSERKLYLYKYIHTQCIVKPIIAMKSKETVAKEFNFIYLWNLTLSY